MKIYVKYGAWSNINYKGTWEIEVEDDEWEEADEEGRNAIVNEEAQRKLLDDVSWDYETP